MQQVIVHRGDFSQVTQGYWYSKEDKLGSNSDYFDLIEDFCMWTVGEVVGDDADVVVFAYLLCELPDLVVVAAD